MSKHDVNILENLYTGLYKDDILLNENLVLKKRPLEDGKLVFVVDSDLTDPKQASNETFKLKEKIKSSKLFKWDANLSKWTSINSFTPEEFSRELPNFKRAILSLNKDFDESNFDAMHDDLEEYLALNLTDRIKEFLNDLKKKVVELKDDPEIVAFREFSKKFTNRSFNNQLLIWVQKKDSTHVEGKATWKNKFGRRLKLGAKSIKIYVPIKSRQKGAEEDAPSVDDKTRDETRDRVGFVMGNVYDISDTEPIEGKEHLYAKEPKWWDETTPDDVSRFIYDALIEFAKEKRISVDVSEDGLGGARGVSRKGSIQIIMENIAVLIHELAHEILHATSEIRRNTSREIKELQAEGVAYAVLRHYELPYSQAETYLTLWKADPDNIKQNEDTISSCAKMLIDYINNKRMEDVDAPEQEGTPEVKPESFKQFFFKNTRFV